MSSKKIKTSSKTKTKSSLSLQHQFSEMKIEYESPGLQWKRLYAFQQSWRRKHKVSVTTMIKLLGLKNWVSVYCWKGATKTPSSKKGSIGQLLRDKLDELSKNEDMFNETLQENETSEYVQFFLDNNEEKLLKDKLMIEYFNDEVFILYLKDSPMKEIVLSNPKEFLKSKFGWDPKYDNLKFSSCEIVPHSFGTCASLGT